MSYQVLARKWRPKIFEQLVGQQHVVTVLTNTLMQGRIHHAYLFTGTRGVGKTTIARIFAKSLNCEQGVTATPCGVCSACTDIDVGRFVDLIEVDAASKTKVDDTREILENVQYAPSRGRYKVYLIDEVHMLSRSSFNALLKTLEEPPEHVKFILATTDPQKLPITVVSRCLQFHLRALTRLQIETKLTEILKNESVTYDASALSILAKAAQGSMRDALSLTDQAIAQGQAHIEADNVQTMLGGIDQKWSYKLVQQLIKGSAEQVLNLSAEIATLSPSYSKLMADILQLFHTVALYQIVPAKPDLTSEQATLVHQFSQRLTPEDVQLYYQIMLNGRKDLPYCIDEQAGFDMTLMRLLSFRPMTKSDIKAAESVESNLEPVDDFVVDVASDSSNMSAENTELAPIAMQPHTEQVKSDEGNSNNIKSGLDEGSFDQQPLAQPQHNLASSEYSKNISATYQQFDNHDERQKSQQSNSLSTDSQSQSNVNQLQATTHLPHPAESTSNINDATEGSIDESPMASVLATRNMLRSKKKQLEQSGKKNAEISTSLAPLEANVAEPDLIAIDTPAQQLVAKASQLTESQENLDVNQQRLVPAIEEVNQEAIEDSHFDPQTIRKANQVDRWANMIDNMAFGGRLRQLALHAEVDEASTDNHLKLKLRRSFAHLNTQQAFEQLVSHLSQLLQTEVTVDIDVVEDVNASPYEIQNTINDKRLAWAQDIINSDDTVLNLVENFDASVDQDSIQPR